jgi:lysyl endopeptidase
MGPGIYSITYGPTSSGEPHLTTINGMHYDFQSVGEFVFLRNPEGMEIQTRQAPIPTTYSPGADPHDELATCVSINTAAAARVGKHRVTYEPNLSGVPDPGGLQLRVDGVLTTLGPGGIDLGGHGRITKTMAPGGLQIDFPDGSNLFVTPSWWDFLHIWYLDVDALPARPAAGIAGAFMPDTLSASASWLPALPDGTSMGPMPTSLHDRFVALYQKFTDAWRVTSADSLFDYAPGTSTDTFTMHTWPPEHPPCSIPGKIPVEPLSEAVAKQVCQSVTAENASCVFDVRVTGNAGFATTYALRQGLQANPATETTTKPCDRTLLLILGGLLLLALILLLICWLRRAKGV